MSEELNALRRAYRLATGQEQYRASIGDANGVMYEPGRTDYYRVRIRQADGLGNAIAVRKRAGVSFAVNTGTAVILARSPIDGQMEIIGEDLYGEIERGINPRVHNAADPSVWGFINQSQFVTLLCHPISSPVTDSTEVAVRAWMYLDNGVMRWFAGDSIDLAGDIPVTADYHGLSGVFLLSDNTLASYVSTEQSTATDLDLTDVQECIDQAPEDAVPIWFWKLENGQTRIEQGDSFLDARQFITRDMGLHVDSILTDDDGDVISDANGNVLTEA